MELWIPFILQGQDTHLENWWKSVGQVLKWSLPWHHQHFFRDMKT